MENGVPQYFIWTIGCQMNQAESERLGSYFERLGYQPAENEESASIIVLNSCVVRQSAEDRVINKLYNLRQLRKKHPDVHIALTGCLVDSNSIPLKKRFPHIDQFFKPGELPSSPEITEKEAVLPERPSPCSFVPIIQGCNNFCSYCIVPYRRGREKSRPQAEIVCEVRELVRRGTREITLLGQNVDSYGHDLPDKPELAGLLEELNAIEGLLRIRFLTNHPKDLSNSLIEAMARLDKVCEQVNLPVQSGDDDILKLMRRGYTAEQYRDLVGRIRRSVPEVALSTDVIVGFPSETRGQFENTFKLLEELRFDTVHIAAYSPRPGTIAEKLEDDVPPSEKKSRLAAIESLQEKVLGEINSGLLGQTVEVLVEGKNRGKWQGRTRSGKLVFFTTREDCTGQLKNIQIEKTSPWSLQGKIIK